MVIPVGICFDRLLLLWFRFNTQFYVERKVKVSKGGEREGGLTWDSAQAGKSFMQAGEVQSLQLYCTNQKHKYKKTKYKEKNTHSGGSAILVRCNPYNIY